MNTGMLSAVYANRKRNFQNLQIFVLIVGVGYVKNTLPTRDKDPSLGTFAIHAEIKKRLKRLKSDEPDDKLTSKNAM